MAKRLAYSLCGPSPPALELRISGPPEPPLSLIHLLVLSPHHMHVKERYSIYHLKSYRFGMRYKMTEYTQDGRDARQIPCQPLDVVQMPLQYIIVGATDDHQHAGA